MQHYSLGFMFNKTKDQVVLIRRIRADWQQGMLNGVGGKIEPGENSHDSMVREFTEETGVATDPGTDVIQGDWRQAIRYILPSVVLHIFVTIDHENQYCTKVEDRGEGVPSLWRVDEVLRGSECVPNLKWIIPLLLAFTEDPNLAPFDIRQSW